MKCETSLVVDLFFGDEEGGVDGEGVVVGKGVVVEVVCAFVIFVAILHTLLHNVQIGHNHRDVGNQSIPNPHHNHQHRRHCHQVF